MYSSTHTRYVGIVLIAVGIGLFIYFAGDLVFRLLGALSAVSLVNYGLRLCGYPPLQTLAQRLFMYRYF